MNLYAILPAYAPSNEVEFFLDDNDEHALAHGVAVAAHDIADRNYFSPSAHVYLIASNVVHVGEAVATDAPRDWKWAHPAVEENVTRHLCDDIENEIGG